MTATKISRQNQLDMKLLYVSSDHTLVGLRRINSVSWTVDEIPMEVTAHPFSNIASISRTKADPTVEDTFDVVFLDDMGNGNIAAAKFKARLDHGHKQNSKAFCSW